MDTLEQFLADNVGQTLTPELIKTAISLVPCLATSRPLGTCKPVDADLPSYPRLITSESTRFVEWVANMVDAAVWDHAYGMGMVDINGDIVCGVVFEDYNGVNASIHVAGIGKYWLSRTFLYSVFDYAFNQLKLKRLTGLVAQGNDAALRFDLNLGFKVEAILKDAHQTGDIYLLVMRPEDCRYLKQECANG